MKTEPRIGRWSATNFWWWRATFILFAVFVGACAHYSLARARFWYAAWYLVLAVAMVYFTVDAHRCYLRLSCDWGQADLEMNTCSGALTRQHCPLDEAMGSGIVAWEPKICRCCERHRDMCEEDSYK